MLRLRVEPLSDDDDDLLKIITSDDDDDSDDQNGPDRRRVKIENRPERQIRSGQSIRPGQSIRSGELIRSEQSIRPFSTIIKKEPIDPSVVAIAASNVFDGDAIGNNAAVSGDPDRGVGKDIDNLLDRQMARARQRLQQQGQKKSSIQKKRSLNADAEGSSQQKRRAITLKVDNIKNSKPGFQS